MLITRRRLLTTSLAALPLLGAPALARADCQPVDLAKGIGFKRQDGKGVGVARGGWRAGD